MKIQLHAAKVSCSYSLAYVIEVNDTHLTLSIAGLLPQSWCCDVQHVKLRWMSLLFSLPTLFFSGIFGYVNFSQWAWGGSSANISRLGDVEMGHPYKNRNTSREIKLDDDCSEYNGLVLVKLSEILLIWDIYSSFTITLLNNMNFPCKAISMLSLCYKQMNLKPRNNTKFVLFLCLRWRQGIPCVICFFLENDIAQNMKIT